MDYNHDYFRANSNGPIKRPRFSGPAQNQCVPSRAEGFPPRRQQQPVQWGPNGLPFFPRVSAPSYQCQPMYTYNEPLQYEYDAYNAGPQFEQGVYKNQQPCYNDDPTAAYVDEPAARKRPANQPTSSRESVRNDSKASVARAPLMRILSGGVEKVLLWTKLISAHPVLFEVIGKMDYVREGKFSCEKIFTLKDVTPGPAIQVTFYETDRLLPQLEPGSLIKVVGSMKSRSRFQAFCVAASSPEELQDSQHVFFICDRAAQELARQKIPQ